MLAVAASLSGISNGFALDDVQIIVENERVHSLIGAWRIFTQAYWPPSGGSSLYRPLTSLGFVIQWAVGGGSPLPFHIVSIALTRSEVGSAAVCVRRRRLSDERQVCIRHKVVCTLTVAVAPATPGESQRSDLSCANRKAGRSARATRERRRTAAGRGGYRWRVVPWPPGHSCNLQLRLQNASPSRR